MLSCAKIGRSSWRYYQKTVAGGACDYFLGHGDAPGRWHGAGLPQLGLTSGALVGEQQLEALFGRALSPSTDLPLGRGWAAGAVTGYDLTFSAPKSVSALWALGDDQVAAAISAAHAAAVAASLDYLQTHVAKSRRGRGGMEQVATAGFTAAVFDHRTSRTGDPQLHSHCLVVNKVLCEDGAWRSVDGHEVYHHLKSGTAIYQAALRAELTTRLPIVFGPVTENGHADILGVPEELLTAWSTRQAAAMTVAVRTIADAEAELGRVVTAEERAHIIDAAVLTTRPPKENAPAEGDLRGRWRDQAAALGWDGDRLQSAVMTAALGGPVDRTHDTSTVAATRRADAETDARGTAPADARVAADELSTRPGQGDAGQWRERVMTDAVTAVGRTKAIWSRADLAAHVASGMPRSRERTQDLSTARASALTADALPTTAADVVQLVEELTDRALASAGYGAVPLGPHHDGPTPRVTDARYASAEVVAAEARITERALTGGFRGPTLMLPEQIDRALAGGGFLLSAEQRQAAVRLVCSKDRVSIVTAPAGAGKTTMLAGAVQLWHFTNKDVITLAPSARAASELGTATGTPGRTVASWLLQQRRLEDTPGGDRSSGLGRHSVVIVDEASMLTTADLDELTARVTAARASLVLVGDPAQIGAVNAPGGMFEVLATKFGDWTIELTELHRFQQRWEADATLRLRSGDASVLSEYAAHGRVHPAADSQDAADAVFAHWHDVTAAKKDALMLARSWTDVAALNARARAAGIAMGQITGPDLVTVTSRTASTGRQPERRSWRAGDVLIAKKNNTRLPIGADTVRNGDRFHVTGAGPDGSLVVTDLRGRGTTTLPHAYLARHTEYGWAATIDGAQGGTADIGIVLARSGLDREHLYVAMSRGREENHVHTTPDLVDSDAGPHREPHSAAAPTAAHRPRRREFAGHLELIDPAGLESQRIQPVPVQAATVDLGAALDQLAVAVRTSGRERAAHSLLDRPVADARDHAWRLRDAATPPRPIPDEHQRRLDQLQALRGQREVTEQRGLQIREQLEQLHFQLDSLPFYVRRKRQDLAATISAAQNALSASIRELTSSDNTLGTVTRSVAADAHQRDMDNTQDRDLRRAKRERSLAGPLVPYKDPNTIGELHQARIRSERDTNLGRRRSQTPTRPVPRQDRTR